MYGVVLKPGGRGAAERVAEDLAEQLRTRGVETRPFFLGMHEQPAFHRMGLFEGETYPVTEMLARHGLYLPSGTALTRQQVEEVCAAVMNSLS
jgi:perosamine synthetase